MWTEIKTVNRSFYIYSYMENSENRREKLIKMFGERREEWALKTWKFIREKGPEKWTEGYVLSHSDKMDQLDGLIEYFENVEEYEICEYLLSIKTTTNKQRYML